MLKIWISLELDH